MKNKCRFNFFERLIVVILFILIFSLIVGVIEGKAFDSPDYDYPIAGWTSYELEEATAICVLNNISEANTEYAALMLETICYYNVIANKTKEDTKND